MGGIDFKILFRKIHYQFIRLKAKLPENGQTKCNDSTDIIAWNQ